MINNTKENKLQIIQKLYSLERVNDYKQYCKNINNDDEVYELYFLNELLSIYFFNLISNIEIALRNKIHKAINICYESSHYANYNKNTKWYDYDETNQKVNIFHILKDKSNKLSGQIIDKLQEIKSEQGKSKDKERIDYIHKYKESILISRLNFGFWNFIIKDNLYYDFIKNIIKIKNNKYQPSNSAFKPFSQEVDQINKLRNRIAHNENIIKDIAYIEKHFNFCKNILHRICDDNPKARAYILTKPEIIFNTSFREILKRIKNIHK